jgi:hypothetical protein
LTALARPSSLPITLPVRTIAATVVLWVAIAHLVRSVGDVWHTLDLPLMQFIAERSLAGDLPYRDLWDMNGPAIYQIHMLLAFLPGPRDVAYQGFGMLVYLAILLAGWRIASGLGRAPIVGAIMMALAALWFSLTAVGTLAQRDVVIGALVLLALWLMLERDQALWRPLRRPDPATNTGPQSGIDTAGKDAALERGPLQRRTLWRWAIAGALIGYAVGIKPLAAPYALVAFAASLALPGARSERIARAAGLAIGGAIGGLLWFGWLLAIGAVDDWWVIMTAYNGGSYRQLMGVPLARLATMEVAFLCGAAIAMLLAALVFWDRRGGLGRGQLALVLAFLACAMASVAIQGKGWDYHMAPAVALSFIGLGTALSNWAGLRTPLALACLAAAGLVYAHQKPLTLIRTSFHTDYVAMRYGHVAEMAQALRNLPQGMKVQAIDTTDGALDAMMRAGRASASPVLYDFWLFTGSETFQERSRQAVLDGLRTSSGAVLVTNQGWPDAERGSGFARLAGFEELDRLLHDEYRLVAEGGRDWFASRFQYRLYAPAGADH